MNIAETSILLAKIQSFDNRNVDDAAIISWQEVLEPHMLADALEAVKDYFKTNAAWIMPSHIVERVRETEHVRMERLSGYHLNPADEERALESGAAWSAAMRDLGKAIRTGELTPAAYEAYQNGNQPLEAYLTTTRKAIQ